MIVTPEALDGLFKGYSVAFNKGLEAPETAWSKIAMLVPSNTASETYAWLGQAPRVREWIGERVVRGLSAYGYSIVNRKFEDTISVPRTMIDDDQYGIFQPLSAPAGAPILDRDGPPDRCSRPTPPRPARPRQGALGGVRRNGP